MTNYERWLKYTDNLSSPNNFIQWGWLYLIGAALQRRVYIGPEHQPLYPNMYCILVGPPGVGKGLVIREVSEFLKHWKQSDRVINAALNVQQKQTAEILADEDLQTAQEVEFQGKTRNAEIIKPLLIPVAADATTYEALVKAVAESYRCISHLDSEGKLKTYGHSSLCFSLQELSSLMRKRTEDTVNYMLGLYDCPVDYEYLTVSRGKERVRRGCLNVLAGTTPGFMQSTFDDRLADEGFNSRVFYINATKNRKNQFWIPTLTEDQKEQKKILLEHIRQLTGLFGNVKMSEESKAFLTDWWDKQEKNRALRSNTSLKLVPYYARKNIHVMKVAMALHFGESLEMEIPLETFKKAIALLHEEEKNMSLAITLGGDNPLAKVAKKLLDYLSTGQKNFVEMLIETNHMTDKKGLEEALDFLQETGQVTTLQLEEDGKSVMYWRMK